jgi:putative DNA primase/helicase
MSAAEVAFALGGRANGTGWKAHCPCHNDDNASLSIGEGSDGRVLFHCHAGCSQDELVAHVRGRGFDLSGKQRRQRKPAGGIVAEYDYLDRDGVVRYRVVRREPKDFRQCQPDGNGGWKWSMTGVEPLPYRLPEMLAEPHKPVYVVEGEKDADRLAKDGLVATCNSGGAGKFRDELSIWFKDRDVVILPDNDEPGRKHAIEVALKLRDVARRTRIVALPGLSLKGDASDWLDAGNTTCGASSWHRHRTALRPIRRQDKRHRATTTRARQNIATTRSRCGSRPRTAVTPGTSPCGASGCCGEPRPGRSMTRCAPST